MSASPSLALEAIASQLVVALEQYEADTQRMIDGWPDIERYRGVSAQIEKIRLYTASLPDLRVQWVELLIAHAELIHFLWRMQYGHQPDARAQIGQVRQHHADRVHALLARCQRLQQQQPAPRR